MTNCQVYHSWMSLKLDGLLEPEQEQALQAHLSMCDACQAEWEAMQFVSRLLEGQSMIPAPAGFVAGVERRLAAAKNARRREVAGAITLVLGALSLVTLGLSSLAGGLVNIWPLLVQPSLWEGVKGWFSQIAQVALAVGEAIILLLSSIFNVAGGPILLAYMLALVLLTLLWSRLVLGRVRTYQPISK